MGLKVNYSIKRFVCLSGKNSPPKGVYSVEDDTIRNNLMGVSRFMNKKGWVDSQGRKGKGFGVYRFASKYGTNIDGYSPIYRPDDWSETGDTFSLGTKGLIAWAGLVVVLLGVGGSLIVQTSQLS